jgi:hypothetical protein
MKRDRMKELMQENERLRGQVDVWRRSCATLALRMGMEPPALGSAPPEHAAGLLDGANGMMELLELPRIEGEADALARLTTLRTGAAPQDEWQAWWYAQAWLALEMYLSSVTSAQA